MPNINITVDETTYREARIWAAVHNTNVSEMVRRFLDIVAHDAVAEWAGNATPPDERLEAIASTFNEDFELPVIPRNLRDKLQF
jgi:hypothetical protein